MGRQEDGAGALGAQPGTGRGVPAAWPKGVPVPAPAQGAAEVEQRGRVWTGRPWAASVGRAALRPQLARVGRGGMAEPRAGQPPSPVRESAKPRLASPAQEHCPVWRGDTARTPSPGGGSEGTVQTLPRRSRVSPLQGMLSWAQQGLLGTEPLRHVVSDTKNREAWDERAQCREGGWTGAGPVGTTATPGSHRPGGRGLTSDPRSPGAGLTEQTQAET